MRRRLQAIYWRGILLTLLIALAAIGVTAKLAIEDAHSHMRALLQAASMWTMDSNDDFQTLADAIARVSPQLRVTFMMDSGLTLADSADGAEGDANHYSDPEIVAARRGETGQSLRMSKTGASLVLYMAVTPADFAAELPGVGNRGEHSPVRGDAHSVVFGIVFAAATGLRWIRGGSAPSDGGPETPAGRRAVPCKRRISRIPARYGCDRLSNPPA